LNQAKNIYTDSSFLGRPRGAKIDLIFGSMQIYRIIAHSGANEHTVFRISRSSWTSSRYDFVFVDTNPSTKHCHNVRPRRVPVCHCADDNGYFSVRGILMLKDIFSDRFICPREDPMQIIGIWNMVAIRHRHTDKLSTADRTLQSSNPNIFRTALANWIYDIAYLHYEGKRRGFLHDFRYRSHRSL